MKQLLQTQIVQKFLICSNPNVTCLWKQRNENAL